MRARALRVQRKLRRLIRRSGEPVLFRHRSGSTPSSGGGTITRTTVDIVTRALVGESVSGFLPRQIITENQLAVLAAPLLDKQNAERVPQAGDELFRSEDDTGEKLTAERVRERKLAGVPVAYIVELTG